MTVSPHSYALVTGASSGIGYQYALQLAQRGYNLLIVSNMANEIVEKAQLIKNQYAVEVIPLVRDLGRPDAARELYE